MIKRSKSKAEPLRERDVERCPICWGWIDRNRPQSKFEHRGRPPNPRELSKQPEVFENEFDFVRLSRNLAAGEAGIGSFVEFFKVGNAVHCELVRVEPPSRIQLFDVIIDLLSRCFNSIRLYLADQLVGLQNLINY